MQSKPITLNDTVARADGLLSADLDNETVLLGIAQGAYFGLTDTAQRIWQAAGRATHCGRAGHHAHRPL